MAWSAARSVAADVPPVAARAVSVTEAAGQVLAMPVWARSPLPPADCSAMDGWAVRGPGPWRVTGRVLAGDVPPQSLADAEAVQVATGAAVPAGCEGVVPTEQGVVIGSELTGTSPAGGHLRRRGEEVPALTALLPAGTLLTPAAAGLVAATGSDAVTVYPRPSVAVLVTGSELVTTGLPGPGRIRDALGPMLPATLRGAGAVTGKVSVVADGADALAEALRAAAAGSEVVVVTGSTAAGPADVLRRVLRELGTELVVDGVACRPGHPMLLAVLGGGTRVVGLPGNPLAALVATVTLAVPLIAALRGLASPTPTRCRAARPIAAHGSATRLVPVTRRSGVALPTGADGPAMLRGAAVADGMAVVGPGRPVVAGDDVQVVDIPGAAG